MRIGEVIELKRGYDLPQQDRKAGAVPVVSSSGARGFHSVSMAKAPGVVTGRYGTLGQVFFVTQDYWPLNTTLYVRDFKGNDPKFVSYLLKTIDFLSCSDKAAVPGVNRNHLHELHVRIPPLPHQRTIAHILGTLDDKIELNRRTNDTLEAMARALFKSWFVDFDPVRAKAEGRQPSGMDAETAKLFPSEFVESELGRIPKGWRVGTIGDLIAIHDAKHIPLSAREREQRRSRYPYHAYHGATSVMDHIDGFLFDGTFVLVGEDGSVVTEAGLPFTQYVWGQFWVNNHAHVLSGLGGMSQEHLFLLLSQTNITAFVTGAVQAKLNQGNLRRIPTVVPPPAVSVRFGSAHADLFARFRSNVEETRTLARARDELLPRLLSGELSVANAASAMEAIA